MGNLCVNNKINCLIVLYIGLGPNTVVLLIVLLSTAFSGLGNCFSSGNIGHLITLLPKIFGLQVVVVLTSPVPGVTFQSRNSRMSPESLGKAYARVVRGHVRKFREHSTMKLW